MDGMLPHNQEEDVLCCCNPKVPHNESMKFKIISKPENLDTVIFSSKRSKGELIQLNNLYTKEKIPNIAHSNFLIGRNVKIYECVKYLTNESYDR